MNEEEVRNFMEKLNIASMDVIESHEYDEVMGILHIDLKNICEMMVESVNGYMSFKCDALEFNPSLYRICFLYEDEPHLDLNFRDILNLQFV